MRMVNPETARAKDALVAAREVLRERGWTKWVFERPDTGCVCAVGALSVAVTGRAIPPSTRDGGLFEDAWVHLIRAAGESGGARFGPVEEFNNAEDTTEGDIYDLFDRAIAAAEAAA